MSDTRYIPELQVHPWQKEVDRFIDTAGYGDPATGNRSIMTDGANEGKIIWKLSGTSLTITPSEGWKVYDLDTSKWYIFTGTHGVDGKWIESLDSIVDSIINESFIVGDGNDSVTVKTPAEVLAILSGEAAAAFDFNSKLVSVGSLKVGADGDVIEQIEYDTTLKCALITFA